MKKDFSLKNKRLLFYDFETTGLWNWINQPIQVCIKEVDNKKNKITIYRSYIKCNHRLDIGTIKLTGITDELLSKEGKDIKNVFKAIKNIIFKDDNFILIGHNILAFDNLFLNYYLQYFFTLKYQVNDSQCFDTAAHFKAMRIKSVKPTDLTYGEWHKKILSRKVKKVNYSLKKACNFYKIKYADAHNADADVEMTHKVFLKQKK